jgi:tol-pal system protein YbgF
MQRDTGSLVFLTAAVVAVLSGCATGRMGRLEDRTAAVEKQTAGLSERLESLERTKEELGRQDREARAVSEARLSDTETRLATLEEVVRELEERLAALEDMAKAGAIQTGMELQPEERDLYDAAYVDFARAEYGLALSGFKAFLERFPSSSLADNAVYWMGECYAAQQRWDEAIAQYRLLRERYPDGDKVKSALLKEGMTLLETGRQSQGETVLQQLLQAFPRSEEARVAREQLARGG